MDHVPIREIQPSHENDQLYRPVDSSDPEIVAPAFDYAALSPDDRQICQGAAERITASRQRRRGDAIAIGRELLQVKRLLGHGRFGEWIKGEFSWTIRTAPFPSCVVIFRPKTEATEQIELDFLAATKLIRAAVVRIRERSEERAKPALSEFLRTLAHQIEIGLQ